MAVVSCAASPPPPSSSLASCRAGGRGRGAEADRKCTLEFGGAGRYAETDMDEPPPPPSIPPPPPEVPWELLYGLPRSFQKWTPADARDFAWNVSSRYDAATFRAWLRAAMSLCDYRFVPSLFLKRLRDRACSASTSSSSASRSR